MNLTAPPSYSIYWDLPVLIVVVSLVYSATRFDTWGAIFGEAARWGLRMSGFLGGIGVVLYGLSSWIDAGAPVWVLALAGSVAVLALLALFAFTSKRQTMPS